MMPPRPPLPPLSPRLVTPLLTPPTRYPPLSGAVFYLSSFPFDRLPHLQELGLHDRVLEESSAVDMAPIAGRLKHLGRVKSAYIYVG